MSRHTFGPFVLDSGRLLRDGDVVAVGQRGLAVLDALLESDGAVVAKADLLERAWPGTIVEEGNLSVQIAALRKALGQDTDGRDWIVTVPRVGYRLARGVAPSRPAAAGLPEKPALAVLPFANLGGDAEQDWFADGVVEDITTALSRFRGFAVLARNSSFAYKGRSVDIRQAAAELGVRYVLEGSIRRTGDRLRIAAQLVEADGGAHLWADSFDGTTDDVFDFQDRITQAVATTVVPQIQRAEIERSRRLRPGSIASYDLYLQALAKILAETERQNAEAFALLSKGLRADPENAQLNALAAWALEHRITMGWPALAGDDRTLCYEYARRGLEHGAGDPAITAHCAMALIQVARKYDWGMAVLESAVEANPNNMMVMTSAGVANLHCGEIGVARDLFLRATRLSPRDLLAHISLCGLAHVEMILGDYEAAMGWAARALAANPNFDPIYWMLSAASAHLGRMNEARRYLGELRRIAPGVTIGRIREGQPSRDPGRLAAIFEGLRLAGLPES
jgi:TolB-like protein